MWLIGQPASVWIRSVSLVGAGGRRVVSEQTNVFNRPNDSPGPPQSATATSIPVLAASGAAQSVRMRRQRHWAQRLGTQWGRGVNLGSEL